MDIAFTHSFGAQQEANSSKDEFECLEDEEEDLVGTSPINLPDPSLFSDFPENDLGNLEEEGSLMLNSGQGGRAGDELIIEEENEKRKLE